MITICEDNKNQNFGDSDGEEPPPHVSLENLHVISSYKSKISSKIDSKNWKGPANINVDSIVVLE